jgi:apolipoprotein N-acyltransferase
MENSSISLPRKYHVVAYPAGWRWPVAGLFALSRLSLVVIALMLLLGWFISPPLLARLILFLALVPGLLVMLFRMLFAAECEVSADGLSLRRTGLMRRWRFTVRLTDIQTWTCWSVPAPGPGLSISLAGETGTRELVLETRHATSMLASLDHIGPAQPPEAAPAALAYCEARAASRLARWHWPVFKFGLFGLLPVLVVFRLHQNIMYGGLLGQYYLQGLGPWLSSLAYHWILVSIYLVLYAAFWRSWVELICWLGTRYAPARAGQLRAGGEILALTAYFAGIPAFIVWRSFF